MGTKEQDLILGRLTRESAQCRRNIAAIEAKLAEYCGLLDNVSLKIRWTWKTQQNAGATLLSKAMDEAMASLPTIPDQQAISDTLVELRQELERSEQITSQLSRMTF
ncbi:MAG TPA: hypothetical protein VME17_09765 [Bryobacteraceae bacterium]|nr:hypothetical protein [Bryobacteraceae bacterium]